MPEVFLSLGSNIDKEIHIPAALRDLEERFGPLTVSGLYENEPVGFQGPPFHNLVAAFHTGLPVRTVAAILAEIEARHGRTREGGKFASHTLDIDLLLYGDLILDEGRIRLPRDDITRCAFVLEPLAEIAPHKKHPVSGATYAKLWAGFDKSGWQRKRIAL
jgi:2-amino-4-hydroxy-6-hydroxymethyldihydropteridine diphosphokinase